MTAVIWSDPCARFAALRDAYYQIISGGNESYVRYKGPEGEREVRYANTNLEALKAELRDAETACLSSQGLPLPKARRFAITAGSRAPAATLGGWWTIGGQFRS